MYHIHLKWLKSSQYVLKNLKNRDIS
jgi:hypothetical protein